MLNKVFIDTDVILDVALARVPFFQASRAVLAMAENGIVLAHVSSNCIANLYYILRKSGGDSNARKFIAGLVSFVTVIPVEHQNVLDSLESKFSDSEDALQNSSAMTHQCEYIITRNIGDYKHSALKVFLPEELVRLYQ